MAQVDFSNAVFDVNSAVDDTPFKYGTDMLIEIDYGLKNVNRTIITSNAERKVIYDTPSKRSILWAGKFTASGTECYIGSNYYSRNMWKISNISFSAGDTYSFVIDIEVNLN